jgi:hypothetical protein
MRDCETSADFASPPVIYASFRRYLIPEAREIERTLFSTFSTDDYFRRHATRTPYEPYFAHGLSLFHYASASISFQLHFTTLPLTLLHYWLITTTTTISIESQRSTELT